jgi:hypothetical protein
VAFLRLTRDRRGYENTFLLHARQPGDRPVVLYWYRSAPGVRVGRPALDEDAIRTIEEQHPDIEFDWPHILEVGAITEPEVERRPERQKRRGAVPPKAAPPASEPEEAPATPEDVLEAEAALATSDAALLADADAALEASEALDLNGAVDERAEEEPPRLRSRPHDLLEELVGHEIATRLHARYSEIISRVHRLPETHPQRAAWQVRAEALNPDNWVTPDEVLRGVSRADALFDSLRQELLAH